MQPYGSERCAKLSYMDVLFALLDEQERNDFQNWMAKLAALICSCLLQQAAASLLCMLLFSQHICGSFSPTPQKQVGDLMKNAARILPLVLQWDALLYGVIFAFHKNHRIIHVGRDFWRLLGLTCYSENGHLQSYLVLLRVLSSQYCHLAWRPTQLLWAPAPVSSQLILPFLFIFHQMQCLSLYSFLSNSFWEKTEDLGWTNHNVPQPTSILQDSRCLNQSVYQLQEVSVLL